MKSTIVRAFVAALVLTGGFAVTHAAPTQKAVVTPAHPNTLPVPSCDPFDPSCSLGG